MLLWQVPDCIFTTKDNQRLPNYQRLPYYQSLPKDYQRNPLQLVFNDYPIIFTNTERNAEVQLKTNWQRLFKINL